MADKSISELVAASSVMSADLFILEQSGVAKKLTGQTLENWLVSFADGHGGIQSITKTGTSGLTDTYTILYADTTTSTFTVTNGARGPQGVQTYVWIKYSSVQPTSDQQIYDTPDNWMGIYTGTASTAPTSYSAYKWFNIKGATGNPGTAATIAQQSVTYQAGTSGTTAPSGTWTTAIPTVAPGNFLWTRTVITYNTGTVVTSYSVGRMGIDGSGAVASVNEKSPDANGNIAITATDIPTSDNASIQTKIDAINTSLAGKQPTLGTGDITSGLIAASAVTAAKIANNAVSTLYTATIPANGWTGSDAPYTNTVSVAGLLSSDTPIVDMIPSSTFSAAEAEIEAYGMIYRMVASNGSLTVYATDIPDVDINIQMRSVRK